MKRKIKQNAGTPQAEEQQYQQWRSKLPKPLQWEGDYDLRGLWRSDPNTQPSADLHFPDTFKLPNHPTFSNESNYYSGTVPGLGGYWGDNDQYIKNPPIGPPMPKLKWMNKQNAGKIRLAQQLGTVRVPLGSTPEYATKDSYNTHALDAWKKYSEAYNKLGNQYSGITSSYDPRFYVPEDKHIAFAGSNDHGVCIEGNCGMALEAGLTFQNPQLLGHYLSNAAFQTNVQQGKEDWFRVSGAESLQPGDFTQYHHTDGPQTEGGAAPFHMKSVVNRIYDDNGKLTGYDLLTNTGKRQGWKLNRVSVEGMKEDMAGQYPHIVAYRPYAADWKASGNRYDPTKALEVTNALNYRKWKKDAKFNHYQQEYATDDPMSLTHYKDFNDYIVDQSAAGKLYEQGALLSGPRILETDTGKNIAGKLNDELYIMKMAKELDRSPEEVSYMLKQTLGITDQESHAGHPGIGTSGVKYLLESIAPNILQKKRSVGPMQIRFDTLSPEVRKKLGIKKSDDLYDPDKAVDAMLYMLRDDQEFLKTKLGKGDNPFVNMKDEYDVMDYAPSLLNKFGRAVGGEENYLKANPDKSAVNLQDINSRDGRIYAIANQLLHNQAAPFQPVNWLNPVMVKSTANKQNAGKIKLAQQAGFSPFAKVRPGQGLGFNTSPVQTYQKIQLGAPPTSEVQPGTMSRPQAVINQQLLQQKQQIDAQKQIASQPVFSTAPAASGEPWWQQRRSAMNKLYGANQGIPYNGQTGNLQVPYESPQRGRFNQGMNDLAGNFADAAMVMEGAGIIGNLGKFALENIGKKVAPEIAESVATASPGSGYGMHPTLVQEQRLLNPAIKEKFFQYHNPEVGASSSLSGQPVRGINLMKQPKGRTITPEGYEDFIKKIHAQTDFGPAQNFGKQPSNLGVGNFNKPGAVFSDAPLQDFQKGIIEAHEKNHGVFAGQLSNEQIGDMQQSINTSRLGIYPQKYTPDEIYARMGQFKNQLGFTGNETFTPQHMNLLRQKYANNIMDNNISELFNAIPQGSKYENKFLSNMNKYAFGAVPATVAGAALADQKQYGGNMKQYGGEEDNTGDGDAYDFGSSVLQNYASIQQDRQDQQAEPTYSDVPDTDEQSATDSEPEKNADEEFPIADANYFARKEFEMNGTTHQQEQIDELRAQIANMQSENSIYQTLSLGDTDSENDDDNDDDGSGYYAPAGTVSSPSRSNVMGASMAVRNNNPGNIKYGSFAAGYGAQKGDPDPQGDGSFYARFPTVDAGLKAHKALLTGPGYRNLTVGQAMNKWITGDPNKTGAYSKGAVALFGNKTIADMSNEEISLLRNFMIKNEDSSMAHNLGIRQSGGDVPVAEYPADKYHGLNNETLNELLIRNSGKNNYRGLDSGQPVHLYDERGVHQVLFGPDDMATLYGNVYEHR